MKPRVVIYGAGQMAGLFAYRHSREGFHWELDLAGFVDDHATGEIAGFPILGKSEDLERLKEERGIDSVIMFAVKDPIWRLEKCLELAEKGFKFPSLVDCYVAPEVKIGQGVIIDEKACFLGYSAKIEDFAMIGPYAVVEGDSHLGRGVIASVHSFIGKGVSIGEGTVLYNRVSVKPGVKIGSRCVVAPHIWVRKDMRDGKKNLHPFRKSDNY